MAVIEFGTGLLYLTPSSGNLPTSPSPVSLLLQEASVDFKGDLKKLFTQYQFPIATARGKVDIEGKAKIVNYDPDPVNQTFFAQAISAGMELPVDREAHAIPTSSPFTVFVTNNTTYGVDHGVFYTTGPNSGQMFLNVSPAFPAAAAQYTVNTTSGAYQFATVDNTLGVAVSYTYTNSTRGKTITLSAQVMGYAPVCTIDLWGTFRSKYVGIRLNACTLGNWSYPTKLEDFWVSDVAWSANLDASNNVGKIFGDVA